MVTLLAAHPMRPKKRQRAANVAFGNQIDHWSGLSFVFCAAGLPVRRQLQLSTCLRMSVPSLRFLQSWRASPSACLARSVAFRGQLLSLAAGLLRRASLAREAQRCFHPTLLMLPCYRLHRAGCV
ncbi:hypothetical protein KCP73_04980 [Salmonella enterica subsp. enterica]|nr:hypothetical protein KCP73_04980 [Salmonella enterica subsp. enterica]